MVRQSSGHCPATPCSGRGAWRSGPPILGMWVAEPHHPPCPHHIPNLQPLLASKSVSKLLPGTSPGLSSLLSYANCCSAQPEIVPAEVWAALPFGRLCGTSLRGWGRDRRGTQDGLLGRAEWRQGSDRPRNRPAESQASLARCLFPLRVSVNFPPRPQLRSWS